MQKIEVTSQEAQSADIVSANIEQLRALFPELITKDEGGVSINVDVLKALVGDKTVSDTDEKYGLNWHGKRNARQMALTPSTGTLRPCLEDSVDWDTTQNLMIEGDNLEVLKLLQKSYANKVKLIYIDPPYNTGKDFVYPDNFQDSIKNYLEVTGQINGGEKISSNTEASGRFHTDWLNMMYPRLKLARNLLQDDGVIIVSIDDNENGNLHLLLNEVFGEENYIGSFVVNATPNGRDYGHIAKMHEYAHFYAKNIELTETNELTVKEKKFRFEDSKGGFNIHPLYNSNEAFTSQNRPNLFYPIYLYPLDKINNCTLGSTHATADCFFRIGFEKHPGAIEIYPSRSEKNDVQFVWRWGKLKCVENFNTEILGYRTEQNEYRIVQKLRHTTKLIRSIVDSSEVTSRRGTAEVEEILGGKIASFPKPLGLIQTFIEIGTNSGDLILDFFAGSGTTGHAVMNQNIADGGDRRYILVQLPEPLDPENKEQKAAADFCDTIERPRNIAELTKERLRRVARKIEREGEKLPPQLSLIPVISKKIEEIDLGFRVFKLSISNIRAWNPNHDDLTQTLLDHEEHLLPIRTEADILYELLLKFGLDLCVAIEDRVIGKGGSGKNVHAIGGGVLIACLATEITREDVEPLAQGIVTWRKEFSPTGDTTCIFRDSAFVDDVAKTNLAAILEQAGIRNVRSL